MVPVAPKPGEDDTIEEEYNADLVVGPPPGERSAPRAPPPLLKEEAVEAGVAVIEGGRRWRRGGGVESGGGGGGGPGQLSGARPLQDQPLTDEAVKENLQMLYAKTVPILLDRTVIRG